MSYLPKQKIAFALKMNCNDRGSFTELLKTAEHGQFSVNVSKPGIAEGQHWRNTKREFFIVVAGQGLILEQKISTDEVLEFEVSGERIQAIHMLPRYPLLASYLPALKTPVKGPAFRYYFRRISHLAFPNGEEKQSEAAETADVQSL